VLFFVLYCALRRLVRLVVGTALAAGVDVEMAVLRQQLHVLRRGSEASSFAAGAAGVGAGELVSAS